MRARAAGLALVAVVLSLTVAGGARALEPTREIALGLPVQHLALTGRSVAYVADATPATLRCAQIGLWHPVGNRRLVFDGKEQCREQASTGQGV